MNSETSMYGVLRREINYAREQDRPIVQVRVTADALRGSISTVPVSPERARVLGTLTMVPVGDEGDSAVVGAAENERLLEVIVHPEDWRDLLVEAGPLGALGADDGGSVRTIFGYRVEEEGR